MHGLAEIVSRNTDRQNAEFYRSKLKEFFDRLNDYEEVENVMVDMEEVLRDA